MESTPPSHRSEPRPRIKSASRLLRLHQFDAVEVQRSTPNLSLDIVPCSPMIDSPSPGSNHSLKSPHNVPLRDLLLLSPSPQRRSRTRFARRLEMVEDPSPVDPAVRQLRRRYKTRNVAAMGGSGCASSRNARRTKRRAEQEFIEEMDIAAPEEIAKPRRRRHGGRTKKEKLSLVHSFPTTTKDEEKECSLDQIGQVIKDLVMWKDVAKSSLWFGFGSLCFLSSCFAKRISFSMFSMVSQLGLLFLGLSFLSDSLRQRENSQSMREFKLKEEDIVRVARLILPAANLAISTTRELFSGETCMTLKVAPFLFLGAEYGHKVTMWRISALGFFLSFAGPILYSLYSTQINRKAEYLTGRVLEAWGACSHKKIVAASVATAFWNLSSIRTRVFAAFLFLVVLRYNKQLSVLEHEKMLAEGFEQKQQQQLEQGALIVRGE